MEKIDIEKFLKMSGEFPLLDVRSPLEFKNGHIPAAHNMPLFSNKERAHVGTVYKNEGQKAAIRLGLRYAGPKMTDFVDYASEHAVDNTVLIHCWRGGMRSENMAWLLNTSCLNTYVLEDGYKAYRKAITSFFNAPLPVRILGGKTGSGKTVVLKALEALGEQVIDLEALANHRGSVFGGLGQAAQPTTEQFQNDLFEEFRNSDLKQTIWLEDESSYIGKVGLPEGLWKQMCIAPVLLMEVPEENRVNRLVEDYGHLSRKALKTSIEKIRKKLGGQHMNAAIAALDENDLRTVARILLVYYDNSYDFLAGRRANDSIIHLNLSSDDPADMAVEILNNMPKEALT